MYRQSLSLNVSSSITQNGERMDSSSARSFSVCCTCFILTTTDLRSILTACSWPDPRVVASTTRPNDPVPSVRTTSYPPSPSRRDCCRERRAARHTPHRAQRVVIRLELFPVRQSLQPLLLCAWA